MKKLFKFMFFFCIQSFFFTLAFSKYGPACSPSYQEDKKFEKKCETCVEQENNSCAEEKTDTCQSCENFTEETDSSPSLFFFSKNKKEDFNDENNLEDKDPPASLFFSLKNESLKIKKENTCETCTDPNSCKVIESNKNAQNQLCSQPENICCYEIPKIGIPCNCAYNGPARIDIPCGCNLWIKASFLYWYVSEKGLDLGSEVRKTTTSFNYKAIPFEFDYHPAFKIGIGYNSKSDDWTYYLQYTRFHSKNKTSSNTLGYYSTSGGNIIDNYIYNEWIRIGPGTINSECNFMKITWKPKFDILDFEINRPFYVGKKLVFKPSFGLKGGIIDQKFYCYATYFDTNTNKYAFFATTNDKINSWVIGPKIGLDFDWYLGCNFSCISKLYTSLPVCSAC